MLCVAEAQFETDMNYFLEVHESKSLNSWISYTVHVNMSTVFHWKCLHLHTHNVVDKKQQNPVNFAKFGDEIPSHHAFHFWKTEGFQTFSCHLEAKIWINSTWGGEQCMLDHSSVKKMLKRASIFQSSMK